MHSSFRPFSGQRNPPPGVKLNNGHYQISTGMQSFDDVLGGGLFLGTVNLIKRDRWTDYASLMLKFFIAQGVVCDHQGIIVSLDSDPKDIKNGLMGLSKSSKLKSNSITDQNALTATKPTTRKLGELRNDQMKIAWRYNNLSNASRDLYHNAPVNEAYCSTFDLSTKLDLDSNLLKTFDQADLLNSEDNNGGVFHNLLQLIKRELETLKINPKSVLRIAIDSFASSLWPDMNLDEMIDKNEDQKMVI